MIELNADTVHAYRHLLDLYITQQSWDEAIDKFSEITNRFGGDGPSKYYLNLCDEFRQKTPEEPWDGVVLMGKK